jgi:hypothetical protein
MEFNIKNFAILIAIKNLLSLTFVLPALAGTPKNTLPLLDSAFRREVLNRSSSDWAYLQETKHPVFYETIDLDGSGKKEAIVVETTSPSCSLRHCIVHIFKMTSAGKYKIVSQGSTTRSGDLIGLLPGKTNGWRNLAVRFFSYETRTMDWYAMKFDGNKYVTSEKRITGLLLKVLVSENSRQLKIKP